MTNTAYLANELESNSVEKKDIEILKRVAQWIIKLDNEEHAKEKAEVLNAVIEAEGEEEEQI